MEEKNSLLEEEGPPSTTQVIFEKGYVTLIRVDGTEEEISKIAGLSYESKKGPKLEKLLELEHLSPFEFANVTFKIKAPIFVARQWMRHRTGKYLEKSLRYTEAKPDFYMGRPSVGSEEDKEIFRSVCDYSFQIYEHIVGNGVPREYARAILPTALYTEFYFQMDLRNLIHFLQLRLDKSAQYEIRQYARAMLELIRPYFPTVYEYLN